MKKIIGIFIMLAMLGATAFAAGSSYDIDIDAGEVTITGTAAANEDVLIIVLKPADVADSDNAANVAALADKDFFTAVTAKVRTILKTADASGINAVNFESYKLHFTHTLADAEGNYTITLPMNSTGDDIVYLLVTSGGSYENDYDATSIYVPSTATVATAKANINAATTAAELITQIEKYDFVFGLDTADDVYKAKKTDIANAILVMKNGAAYTSFSDLSNTASFKSNFDEALAYYTRQTAAVDEINSATVDSLKTILENYSQGVNVLGFYGEDKLAFETAYSKFGYMEVNRLLVGRTFDDMEAFTAAFRAVASNLSNAQNNPSQGTVNNPTAPSGPAGGGGGGGGFGGGGMYVPTTQVPKVETDDGSFKDLDQAAWAEESIMNLVARGVVNGMGDGIFNPNGNVTREQFIKMLILSFNIEATSTSGNFADVDAGAWYAPYVNTAYELGIVKGVSDTEFGVGMSITRQDLVTMIMRACDAYGLEVSKTQSLSFNDESAIADYAYDAVMNLAAAGIINGVTEGEFAPTQNATRAQVSVILDRLYNV